MGERRAKKYPTGVRPKGRGIEITFKPEDRRVSETLLWQPTTANLKRAGELRQSIVTAIRHGAFNYAEFFPDSHRATRITVESFQTYAQRWLDDPAHDWKPQTRYKFKGILNRVWMPALHGQKINRIGYSAVRDAISSAVADFTGQRGHDPSPSLYNDWLTALRGVFEYAIQDGVVTRANNPAAELKNKKRIKTAPDPFSIEEADAIIASVYQHDGPMWGAWFELGFFTGMRYPSEPAALKWSDFGSGELRITRIRSKHAKSGIQDSTKTGKQRTILCNSRAQHALSHARHISGFRDTWIFMQVNGPVTTGDPQRAMWRAAIKREGIRYRDPYAMRHSYATIGLMAGANPAFMAGQLGHSVEEFFSTYARWINASGDNLQMELIEKRLNGLGQDIAHPISHLKLN